MSIPSRHDTSFIAYEAGTDPKFERCLPDTLAQEGGYSDDAHDPGGKTDYGIIQKEYDLKRRQWGLPTRWVKLISADEYRTIYYTDYWLPYGPELPAGLDLECFDQCVNEGSHRAIILLQIALKVTADGVFGPHTQAAIQAFVDSKTLPLLIDRYKMAREAFYHALGTFQYFGKDWIRRSETIDKQADAMVTV
jgi:lysozyme family protein